MFEDYCCSQINFIEMRLIWIDNLLSKLNSDHFLYWFFKRVKIVTDPIAEKNAPMFYFSIFIAISLAFLSFILIIFDSSATEDKKSIDSRSQEMHQSRSLMHGKTSRYEWSETFDEMNILVHIPHHSKKLTSKDILIQFNQKYLTVQIQKTDIIVNEELIGEIIPSECSWQIESNNVLISLCKKYHTSTIDTHWLAVLINDTVNAD